MLFAIGTMEPSVDMGCRLPENINITTFLAIYCTGTFSIVHKANLRTRTRMAHTFFDATPTSLCTVYCVVPRPYDLGNGNNPMWASTPARHDCFTDASRTQADGAFNLQTKRLRTVLCVYFAARPSNLRAEASRSRSNMEPRTRNLTARCQRRGNHSRSKRSRSNHSRSKRSRSTQQKEPKQKEANLHSAASPWCAFAYSKACLLAFSTSAVSPGFSNLMPFVLVTPAASTHRLTTRWLRLS